MREALRLRKQWTSELEAAWSEVSRVFPHVDARTARLLREAFAAGYQNERKLPLVIVILDARPAAGTT